MNIKKYGSRNWAAYDDFGNLICVAVYKKGALEVLNRLSGIETGNHSTPSIDIKELTKLQKEIKQLSKKFNNIFNQIKSKNKLNEAVL
ncbi:MAG: hypothetical protein ACYDG2_10385 [Ruminiclostridium sp.]